MRWAGHVARMGEERGVYRVLVGKPEGRRPLGRPRLTHARTHKYAHTRTHTHTNGPSLCDVNSKQQKIIPKSEKKKKRYMHRKIRIKNQETVAPRLQL